MKCRFCKHDVKTKVVDLGKHPLSNAYLSKEELSFDEQKYPLEVFVCENCFLVQLAEFERAENIFSHYQYFSSYSTSWLKHAQNYVEKMIAEYHLDSSHFVVEIASNDGYLLQYFVQKKIPCLGVEPAVNVAKVAEEKGVESFVDFFGEKTAVKVSEKYQKADLIVANNVMAHVPDLNDFVKGFKMLLSENGIITVEFPHVLKLLQENQFDTIYHEHFSYFSLWTVKDVFLAHGLKVFDVEELSTHGGSLRVYATHVENNEFVEKSVVSKLLETETKFSLNQLAGYTDFQRKSDKVKTQALEFLQNAKRESKTIAAYGAAAKGNTLLNFCGITHRDIDFVADQSPHKQNFYMPGSRIPIVSPDEILKQKPDYIWILPWNIKDEIMTQLSFVREWGGQFVVAVPELKIY